MKGIKRISALFEGMVNLEGEQTALHYTAYLQYV